MKKWILVVLLCSFLVPAWADVSPKPEMEFSFIYETQNKPLIDPAHSEQIQCTDNQCLESKPLGHYGIQKLYCSAGKCFSVAYEYTDYQKLVIAFADGSVRESNIFLAPRKLRARFNVHVFDNALTVEPTDLVPDASGWTRLDAWISLLIILVLELLAAAAYAIYTKKKFPHSLQCGPGKPDYDSCLVAIFGLVRAGKHTAVAILLDGGNTPHPLYELETNDAGRIVYA